jgi:CHAT domain-containing protein
MKRWADLFNGNTIIKRSPSKADVLASMRYAKVIALGGHCSFTPGKSNSLVHFLNESNSYQEQLSLLDILNTDISAELVVHTACNSGKGDIDNDNDLISFARAFLYAGAQSIVYTKLPAEEETTVKIFDNFYENLAAGLPKDSALWLAKYNYIKSSSASDVTSPLFWGGFQILGNNNPISVIQHKSGPQIEIYLLLILVAFSIIVVVIKKR